MKIEITNAVFCLTVAAFFAMLQAQPSAPYRQETPPPSDSNSRSVWDGVYTDEQAEHGHSIYHDQCAFCHGDTLDGGEEAPPLAGAQFLSNWNGLTVGDLFERIRKSMPQSNPGKLTREQAADVIAYVFSFNKFPGGKVELPPDAELLKQIRIEATKPNDRNDK
jgi:mono/diheme cytochrome c family protein